MVDMPLALFAAVAIASFAAAIAIVLTGVG
jgi:hypothetical protein